MALHDQLASIPRKTANPRLVATYDQMSDDIGLVLLPGIAHHIDIYIATWSLIRESLLAGQATRTDKEIVCAAVSVANRCPYCVAAHTTFLHATGDHAVSDAIWHNQTPTDPYHAALVDWAKATATTAIPAPFPAHHAPEFHGSALAFHVVNRLASVLLADNLLPANMQKSRMVRRLAGATLSSVARRVAEPGDSLALLHTTDPTGPDWAAGTPIATAYAALRHAASAQGLLDPDTRHRVESTVDNLLGSTPSLVDTWVDEALTDIPAHDLAGARIALLSAIAPYRVADSHIDHWRQDHHHDADLVRLTAYGAMIATDRIAARVTAQPVDTHPAAPPR